MGSKLPGLPRSMTLVLVLLLAALSPSALAAKPVVVVAPVDGIINTGSQRYLERALAEAKTRDAAALLVTLNTPGGLLSSTRRILEFFGSSTVPVIVYVTPAGASATSAGAILAQGAHIIAMAPGSNIGAAHPVGSQGEDVKGAMGDKVVNDTVAMAKSMAALRGRDGAWIERAIRESVSATADEALKARAIEVVSPDVPALLAVIDGRQVKVGDRAVTLRTATAEQVALPMTTGERVLVFLGDPNITYLLMTAGGLGLYLELSAPGIGLPGVVAVLCFILAFISMQTLPVSTGAVALLVGGIAMLILEIFVTSFGVLAIGGVISMVLGALFLLDPSTGDLRVSIALIAPVAITVLLGALGLGYFLWRTRGGRYKGLDNFAGIEGDIESAEPGGRAGKAHLRGELWDVRLEGAGELRVGDAVTALRREGFVIIIKKKEG